MEWLDNRRITTKQRGLIFGLFSDISDYTGYTIDYIEQWLKAYHKLIIGADTFSLAKDKCSVVDANKFIASIIEYCCDNDIPFQEREYHIGGEIQRILFAKIMKRKCFVCGRDNADIHHAEHAVGMGNSRKTFNHTKSRFMALCREHHTESHMIGQQAFSEKYHLVPIKLDEKNLRELGVMK